VLPYSELPLSLRQAVGFDDRGIIQINRIASCKSISRVVDGLGVDT